VIWWRSAPPVTLPSSPHRAATRPAAWPSVSAPSCAPTSESACL
jgi:hypothetical protein